MIQEKSNKIIRARHAYIGTLPNEMRKMKEEKNLRR
jgi:hypothetical protein